MKAGARLLSVSSKPLLITDSYRELNRKLHASRPDYGIGGEKFLQALGQLAESYDAQSVLDYGAGKCTLERAWNAAPPRSVRWTNYDPCVAGLEADPVPHDIVTCTDVLEHIEPELLTQVLRDLRRLTSKAALLTIATRPAKKYLEDGRNAHLIQESPRWWLGKLWDAGFLIRQYIDRNLDLVVFVE